MLLKGVVEAKANNLNKETTNKLKTITKRNKKQNEGNLRSLTRSDHTCPCTSPRHIRKDCHIDLFHSVLAADKHCKVLAMFGLSHYEMR
jgi:hypothetical protein